MCLEHLLIKREQDDSSTSFIVIIDETTPFKL